jgi:hypothetical protein
MPPVDREQGIFWKVNISLMPLMVMNRTIVRIARSLIHPLTVDLAPEGDPSCYLKHLSAEEPGICTEDPELIRKPYSFFFSISRLYFGTVAMM